MPVPAPHERVEIELGERSYSILIGSGLLEDPQSLDALPRASQALIVTIAASAGAESIQNVTGTNSATAIVAVRPGTAPMKTPYNAAASMMSHSSPSKTTLLNACWKSSLIGHQPNSPQGSETRR